MFPWLRLIRVAFTLIAAPRVDLLTTTKVSLRVWPNDLDVNLHVNNGRYLALADIGRMHWFVRAAARRGTVARGKNQADVSNARDIGMEMIMAEPLDGSDGSPGSRRARGFDAALTRI